MGVRYRRNMCECLGGRPGPWGGMPRMLCAPAGDLARGGLIVESESFAGRERGCDKSEKTQCYGVVWARPHSALRSGPAAGLNRARKRPGIALRTGSADIAHPLPPRGRGSRPARSLRAGARPARSRQTDRPGSPPARVRTSVPRRGFAMRTGSHTPTLEPCTPALAPSNRILSRSLPRGVRRGAPSTAPWRS